MNAVAFKVFMPVMCFYNIYNSELSTLVRPQLLQYAVFGVLAQSVIGWAYAARFVSERSQKGVVIQAFYRTNYLIIGLPFTAGLAGEGSMGIAAMVGAVVIPLFNVLAVIILEAYSGNRVSVKKQHNGPADGRGRLPGRRCRGHDQRPVLLLAARLEPFMQGAWAVLGKRLCVISSDSIKVKNCFFRK